MATMIDRRRSGTTTRRRTTLNLTAFRAYPDSAGFVKLRLPGRKRATVTIQLSGAEADRLAESLRRVG